MSKNIFTDVLESRFIPLVSTNLSERIIAAAYRQKTKSLNKIIIEEMVTMFIIPRPSIAMAFCVCLGFFVGGQLSFLTEYLQPDYFSFLSFDEGDLL